MRSCLVVCATKQQAACKAAAQIANELRLHHVAVDLECSRHISDLAGYDAVVIGAPLCHGRWQRATRRFLKRNRNSLQRADVALFAPGPSAGGQEQYDRSWNRLIKMLRRLGWLDPVRIEVFSNDKLSDELSCCIPDDSQRIAHWCRGLAVSMHLDDQQSRDRPGI